MSNSRSRRRCGTLQKLRPRLYWVQASPSIGFDPNMLPVVPPGTAPLLTLLGHGTQNYTCIANGDTPAASWELRRAQQLTWFCNAGWLSIIHGQSASAHCTEGTWRL